MKRVLPRIIATISSALLALLLGIVSVYAQSVPLHFLSTASTNSTNVTTTRTLIKVFLPLNTTSTLYYLKLYNKATAPVCGTDPVQWTVPVPSASSSAGGVSLPVPDGLRFPAGLGFCLTGGIADNDTTPAAAGVVINLGVTGY